MPACIKMILKNLEDNSLNTSITHDTSLDFISFQILCNNTTVLTHYYAPFPILHSTKE